MRPDIGDFREERVGFEPVIRGPREIREACRRNVYGENDPSTTPQKCRALPRITSVWQPLVRGSCTAVFSPGAVGSAFIEACAMTAGIRLIMGCENHALHPIDA